MISDDDAEPDFDHADLAALMDTPRTLLQGRAKWLFVDSLHPYESTARARPRSRSGGA
jgi:hypothetical protein